MNLQNSILNIRIRQDDLQKDFNGDVQQAYEAGHKACQKAAAGIAAKSEALNKQLFNALQDALIILCKVSSHMDCEKEIEQARAALNKTIEQA